MKHTHLTSLLAFFLFFAVTLRAEETLLSPNGLLKVTISINSGRLTYAVTSNSENVIVQSALGLNTNKADFSTGLTLISSTRTSTNESYQLPSGKRSTYTNHYNELDLKLTSLVSEFHVVFRAYNDGIAYRYYVPGSGTITVYGETSEVNVANFEKCWGQAYLSDYSTKYPERNWATASTVGSFCSPMLCKSGINWCLITEAANYGNYCVSTLKTGTAGGDFYFAKSGTVTPTLPLYTPWRTVIIGSLPTVTESVLAENLNPASEVADVSWIKPGKASWDWGGQEAKAPWNTLDIVKTYIDLAYKMGWNYFLLDEGWETATYKLSDVIQYANTKGVDVLLWTNSNRFQNNSGQIRPILQGWKDLGFKGVKVDFWKGDAQSEMQKYDKVISIAAELKLLVNLHGCTNPSGTRRRWPNLLTTEAVYGGEQYMFVWDATKADHNINLVFTRNVIGPMDYTPTDFLWADNTLRTLTTWSHQLALATIYESGLQHFIDCPNSYLDNIAGGYLRDLPVTWDETKCLEGEPNQYATLARRKGVDWYVASLCNDARTLQVNLSFLEDGKTYYAQIFKDGITDFDVRYEEVLVKKNDVLPLVLRAHGGVTVRISQNPIEKPAFDTYEAESTENTRYNSVVVTDPNNRCSNNAFVGNIGTGKTVTINKIMAPKAGQYVLALYYMTGQQRNTYVKVNNQTPVMYTFPSSGGYNGNNLALRKMVVTLNEGLNTLTFGNDQAAGVNIDKIIISPNTAYNNVGVTEISTPQSATGLSNAETVTVKISNENLSDQINVPISYTLNDGMPVNEVIPTIPAQTVINYSFVRKADFSKGKTTYKLLVKTQLVGDTNPHDDTLSIVVNNTTTAIEGVKEDGMLVYPTATEGIVHIKFNKTYTPSSLKIVNSYGQVFYQNNRFDGIKDDVYNLDMTNYPVGLYLLQLGSLDTFRMVKILKISGK